MMVNIANIENNAFPQLISVQHLTVTLFESLYKKVNKSKILDDISFSVEAGKCLAIIGESGSGKTTLCKTLLGLLPAEFDVKGKVIYQHQNLVKLSYNHRDWMLIRGKKIAFIPQNSVNAFNPLLTIGNQIYEVLKQHNLAKLPNRQQRLNEAFSAVSLPNYAQFLDKHPYELSGGTLQRISIALAIILKPDIIIADEPTSNIDGISKKEVLSFLKQILNMEQIGLIMVTHDFNDVRILADNIIILHDGKIIEQGLTETVFHHPVHSYIKSLLDAHDKFEVHFQHLLGKGNYNVNHN